MSRAFMGFQPTTFEVRTHGFKLLQEMKGSTMLLRPRGMRDWGPIVEEVRPDLSLRATTDRWIDLDGPYTDLIQKDASGQPMVLSVSENSGVPIFEGPQSEEALRVMVDRFREDLGEGFRYVHGVGHDQFNHGPPYGYDFTEAQEIAWESFKEKYLSALREEVQKLQEAEGIERLLTLHYNSGDLTPWMSMGLPDVMGTVEGEHRGGDHLQIREAMDLWRGRFFYFGIPSEEQIRPEGTDPDGSDNINYIMGTFARATIYEGQSGSCGGHHHDVVHYYPIPEMGAPTDETVFLKREYPGASENDYSDSSYCIARRFENGIVIYYSGCMNEDRNLDVSRNNLLKAGLVFDWEELHIPTSNYEEGGVFDTHRTFIGFKSSKKGRAIGDGLFLTFKPVTIIEDVRCGDDGLLACTPGQRAANRQGEWEPEDVQGGTPVDGGSYDPISLIYNSTSENLGGYKSYSRWTNSSDDESAYVDYFLKAPTEGLFDVCVMFGRGCEALPFTFTVNGDRVHHSGLTQGLWHPLRESLYLSKDQDVSVRMEGEMTGAIALRYVGKRPTKAWITTKESDRGYPLIRPGKKCFGLHLNGYCPPPELLWSSDGINFVPYPVKLKGGEWTADRQSFFFIVHFDFDQLNAQEDKRWWRQIMVVSKGQKLPPIIAAISD